MPSILALLAWTSVKVSIAESSMDANRPGFMVKWFLTERNWSLRPRTANMLSRVGGSGILHSTSSVQRLRLRWK